MRTTASRTDESKFYSTGVPHVIVSTATTCSLLLKLAFTVLKPCLRFRFHLERQRSYRLEDSIFWEVAGQQFVFLNKESHGLWERSLLRFCKRMKRGQIELSMWCCDGHFSGLQKWVNWLCFTTSEFRFNDV